MKKPMVDYRAFRLSRLREPQYSHVILLLDWVFYLLAYYLTEHLIPAGRCHVIHSALDDLIPFHEGFAVFYCFWYVLLVGSLLYFFLYDTESFRCLQIYIIITQVIAIAVYVAYPSVQDLRPAEFPRQNVLTSVMAALYAIDTPTGVCPSLHVAYSIAIATVWCRCRDVSRGWKAFMVFSAVMISISTAFVKQHSTIDILAALPVCLVADRLVYGFPPARLRRSA